MEKKPDNRTKKMRTGDRVIAIAGNEKGRDGVIKSFHDDRAVVQGLNMRKKHIKKTQEAPKGRIVEMEKSIHVSNLKLYVEALRK